MNPRTNQHPAPPPSTPYSRHPALPQRPRSAAGSVPNAFWAALIVGAVAFAVKISVQVETSGSDGYSCSYHNFAGFAAAAAIVVLLLIGLVARASVHPEARLAGSLTMLFTVVLLGLAVVHLLRGTGSIQSECAGQP